jgi:TonB family protein
MALYPEGKVMLWRNFVLGLLFVIPFAGSASSQEQAAPPATAPAAQATPPAKETHPPRIRVPGDVQDKNVIHRVFAIYPPATGKKMTGTVVLHVIISQDGTVQNLEVVSGQDNLRQSALDAVKQWKYRPTLLNDERVEVDTTVNVVFSLSTPPPPDQPPPAPFGIPSDSNAAALETPPAEETRPLRIRVPGDVAKKNLIRPVLPVYPPRAAFDLHIIGTMLMHVIISQDGSVQKVGYISGPKELKDAAMDAMREWKYKPTTLNGQPVEVDTTVKIVFSL